jgi:hypothetical protein
MHKLRSLVFLLVFSSALALAQEPDQPGPTQDLKYFGPDGELKSDDVPAALSDWIGWTLRNAPASETPRIHSDGKIRLPLWVSALELETRNDGADFSLTAESFRENWLILPGGERQWPTEVKIDDQAVPVVTRNSKPAIRIDKGTQSVTGSFEWSELPQRINLPPSIGLLNLRVNGEKKETPSWDGDGTLWLQREASTEQVDEERESGKARKYSWDYDAEFEVYEYDTESGEYRNLTNTKGYDAEGAYSPDGDQIVFASNRQAYDGTMSEADQKAFKLDKKFPMEIYVANADGTDAKRLTYTDGYDGGPFFSADGKKICWRRFDRKGLTAEIFTMNADGSEQTQLTHLGAMSWAPYFHPSGEYLIFATNKHGFDNFELYLVDAAGEKEPVRVTGTEGFDGLPVFSPDGKKLSWTSNRTPEEQSQIFLANWNHQKALAMLEKSGAPKKNSKLSSAPMKVPTEKVSSRKFETTPEITVEDMRNHIGYLASKEMGGRLTGTKGEILATDHVASAFKSWGLEPGGDDESYFQEFNFTAGVAVGKDNKLLVKQGDYERELEVEKDWRPVSFSKLGDIHEAGVVFAGYGLEIPDGEGGESYTSYFHLDVKGKWVMVFRFVPEDVEDSKRQEMQRFSRLRHKATLARRKFAAGIIFVTGPETEVNEELIPMQFDASLADSGIPAISMSTEAATRLVATAGRDLSEIQKKLDTGEMVQGFAIPDLRVDAEIDVDQEKKTGRNVIAVLPSGKGGHHPPPAVVIGAHIDHLGAGAGAGSLAKEHERGQIHFGADDNASGTAGLLEIAEYLSDLKKKGKLEMERDLVFAAWSGEEIGLLGSSHFVRKLAKDTMGNESAPLGLLLSSYLNMDMIGRLDEKVVIQGTGSSDYWRGAVERRNAPIGLPITIQSDTFLPTDATNFYLRKVPILSAFTGAHEDYHTPRDTADKVNYEGATKIAKLMGLIARGLAMDSEVPKYVKVDPPKNRGARNRILCQRLRRQRNTRHDSVWNRKGQFC